MELLFKEMPAFERHREDFLGDDAFKEFQEFLLKTPRAGAVIQGTGGLRKVRWVDAGRGKGKRGGVRVIYYHYNEAEQIWLFTLYGKDERDDLTKAQKAVLKRLLTEALDEKA